MTTLVLVGNGKQPFRRLLDAVGEIARSLPQPVVVQHGRTVFKHPNCELHAFFGRDELADLVAQADLVICHAGAGCVIDALTAGKRPVVMPRRKDRGEVVDDHQGEFAAALAEADKAEVAEDAETLIAAVTRVLANGGKSRREFEDAPLVAMVREALLAAERAPARNRR